MLDHTRRILLVIGIFLVTGWLYKLWRTDRGGYGLFDLLEGKAGETTVEAASTQKLRTEDVPGLAQLSAESAKLAAAVLPSVVSINTAEIGKVKVPNAFNLPLYTTGLVPALGSGVIVSKEGHVITNFHVIKAMAIVQGVAQIKITTHDGKEYGAQVIGFDEQLDVAVLKIKDGKGDFPALSFADSDKARVGEMVFAVGNPFGLAGTVTQGIVCATRRRFSDTTNGLLQTDTVINPGNSGGPLVNIHGQILGINVAIYPGDPNVHAWQGVGLSIPANDVSDAFQAITTQGSPQAGYLGIEVEPRLVDVNVAGQPAKTFKGAVISRVFPGSPAALSGLQSGDVIIRFQGHTFDEPSKLIRDVCRTRTGETKEFDIVRGERRITVKVTFLTRPKEL